MTNSSGGVVQANAPSGSTFEWKDAKTYYTGQYLAFNEGMTALTSTSSKPTVYANTNMGEFYASCSATFGSDTVNGLISVRRTEIRATTAGHTMLIVQDNISAAKSSDDTKVEVTTISAGKTSLTLTQLAGFDSTDDPVTITVTGDVGDIVYTILPPTAVQQAAVKLVKEESKRQAK
ncbi:hypothetical protein [Serratia quinivorans]|uniref:hypothetical protein n=1 Tax=Serratia quinivorans TaxID=137545 RepID=UPI0021BDEE69|nr:hypothetical protein [Serratia quinivorans]